MDLLDFLMLIILYTAATFGIVVLCWEVLFSAIAEEDPNDED